MKKIQRERLPLPEVSELLLDYWNTEAFGSFWINHLAILHYVCTVNVTNASFLHLGSHTNTSFLHIASHYFPMAGLSHLTRVQLKARSGRHSRLNSFKGIVFAMVSRWKEDYSNPAQMHCKNSKKMNM